MKRTPVSVVETEAFMRQVDALLSTSSREELIGFLAFNPEAGDVIPGTGGIRKVRWAVAGKGKRGGLRVIYYFHSELMPLFLLMAYAKSRKTDLSRAEQTALGKIGEAVRQEYLGRKHRRVRTRGRSGPRPATGRRRARSAASWSRAWSRR